LENRGSQGDYKADLVRVLDGLSELTAIKFTDEAVNHNADVVNELIKIIMILKHEVDILDLRVERLERKVVDQVD